MRLSEAVNHLRVTAGEMRRVRYDGEHSDEVEGNALAELLQAADDVVSSWDNC